MADYGYINTELGLGLAGKSTCRKGTNWIKSEDQGNKEVLMATPRSKLRLTNEQSALLEDIYRAQNILTSVTTILMEFFYRKPRC